MTSVAPHGAINYIANPACLRRLETAPRWVGFRWEERGGKWTKPPRTVKGGRANGYARNDDPSTWASFHEAVAAFQAGEIDGLGIQLLALKHFAAIDLDDVRGEDGTLRPWAADLIARAGSYAELTPSGTGARIIGRVAPDHPSLHTSITHPEGGKVELFVNCETGRYITVTGARIPEAPDKANDVTSIIAEMVALDPPRQERERKFNIDTGSDFSGNSKASLDEVREALTWIDADLGYFDWLDVLMALHDHFGNGGLPLALEWSERGAKTVADEVEAKWRGFTAGCGIGIGTVFHLARQGGCDLGALTRKHRFQERRERHSENRTITNDARNNEESEPALVATPFVWTDPRSIPPRPWVYGRHLIRGQVSVTVAPGGVGKSSLTICEGIALASGRDLLGEWIAGQMRVWLFNLEDPRDELQRRITATMLHHGVKPEEIAGRLFADSGRERGLCTAIQTKSGVEIIRPEMGALEAELQRRKIDVLNVDPFVSSHRVQENDNGAIDLVAKEWARLAERCKCAIELVHHTRKLNGEEGSSESGRGAGALLAAARSGRVLNKMGDDLRKEAGIPETDVSTYFSITRDKANLAPMGKRTWCRTASVDLGQGDHVGVVETWKWPNAFEGIKVDDLLSVQRAIAKRWEDERPPQFSDQAGEVWVGHIVADVLKLDGDADKKRIKKLIAEWIKSGALRKVDVLDQKRIARPCVEAGEWANK